VRIEVRDESSFNPNRYPNIGKTKTAPPKKNPKKNVDYASRLIEAAEVRFFMIPHTQSLGKRSKNVPQGLKPSSV
jgi:hypothetical protein